MRSAISTCARVSKTDGSQSLGLQRNALETPGVDEIDVYHDLASGVRDDPAGLVHQEPVEDVGRFVDGGRWRTGENWSERCEYALTPGSAPYRALTRLRASPRPAAGKN